MCTNISCSLLGADEFFQAMHEAALEDIDINVRSFECLGACDIAPMASVNGEYVGPLETADAARIVEDLRAGRPVLESKQLRFRRCVDPGVTDGAAEFSPPPDDVPRTDTAGLGPEGDTVDRPGPSAPYEVPTDEEPPAPGDTSHEHAPDAEPESKDAPDQPPREAR